MMGRGHLIAATALLGVADGAAHGLSAIPGLDWFHSLPDMYHDFVWHPDGGVAAGFGLAAGLALYYLGALLPDLDSGKSAIRKLLHIQTNNISAKWHRTWLHSVWAILFLAAAASRFSILYWLLFGYAGHLFVDMFSVMGICFFYPFQKYREYPNGGRIARGHWLRLYRTGQPSETIVLVLLAAFCALCVGHFHLDIPAVDVLRGPVL